MFFASLFLAQVAAPEVAHGAAARVIVAVTRSGRQLEAAVAPRSGDLEITSPFGVYSTPKDPVAVVMRLARRSLPAFDPTPRGVRAALALVDDLASGGRISALVRLADLADQQWAGTPLDQARLAVHRALEVWGERIDPLPAETPYDERGKRIWRELPRAGSGRGALLAGALLHDLPKEVNIGIPRQIDLVRLRRGARADSARLRRTAMLAMARQGYDDLTLTALLLDASLHDADRIVRDGAASAATSLWPEYAASFWWEALARGKEAERIAAARHFGVYGGPEAVDELIAVLSAVEQPLGKRYSLAGRKLQVVLGTRRPGIPLLSVDPAHGDGGTSSLLALTPDAGRFDHDSVLKITQVPAALTPVLLEALAQRVPDPAATERDRSAWLAWYED